MRLGSWVGSRVLPTVLCCGVLVGLSVSSVSVGSCLSAIVWIRRRSLGVWWGLVARAELPRESAWFLESVILGGCLVAWRLLGFWRLGWFLVVLSLLLVLFFKPFSALCS